MQFNSTPPEDFNPWKNAPNPGRFSREAVQAVVFNEETFEVTLDVIGSFSNEARDVDSMAQLAISLEFSASPVATVAISAEHARQLVYQFENLKLRFPHRVVTLKIVTNYFTGSLNDPFEHQQSFKVGLNKIELWAYAPRPVGGSMSRWAGTVTNHLG